MVKITVCRVGQLKGPEANVIQGFIVDTEGLISVLYELMDGQGGVVWFHHGVGHLRAGYHGVRVHDPVWELLPDLGDE